MSRQTLDILSFVYPCDTFCLSLSHAHSHRKKKKKIESHQAGINGDRQKMCFKKQLCELMTKTLLLDHNIILKLAPF